MIESESLSMISLPDISFPEMNAIPLPCWQDICLSKIWIPSHLLTSRKKPSINWEARGVFRTLEKRVNKKQIESFSVYSDSDNESEKDIFQSDSEDDFDLDSISSETMKIKDDPQKSEEACSKLKSFPVKSDVSLDEILNLTTEVDITKFKYDLNQTCKQEFSHSNKKSKNAKKRNKVAKSVTLDKFLEDYTEKKKQNDYANDYFRKLLIAKNNVVKEDEVQLKNNSEFPDLIEKKIEFMHNEKPHAEKSEIAIKTATQILSQSDENENDCTNNAEVESFATGTAVGKIVIENIPSEICHEDIFTLLCGYGEIKNFTLEPDGDFLKALVEIDLICDIDWITECLNGTEPFGASSRLLKCYKL